MSFDTEKQKLSRHLFEFCKLELDNPISPSGDEYHCEGRGPLSEEYYPSIVKRGIDPVPTRMLPGEGLPYSGYIKFTFQDFPFGDQGTYFGRLIAANPYYQDRPLKFYTGFFDGENFSLSNFKEKLYFIQKIQGPDSNGRVVITAVDPLIQLSEKQARTPETPNAELASSLGAGATGTVNIGDNAGYSVDGGIAKINDEYLEYSGLSGSDSIVVVGRAAYGSSSASHDAGDNINPCYSFEDKNVVDVIRDLIELFSPIDHALYIPDSDWEYQRDTFMNGDVATGVIDAGEPIKGRINALCEYFRVSVWWDDELQKVSLKPIGPLISAAERYNTAENILDEGEDIVRDPSKAVSAVIVHFGRKDHSKDDDEKKNYSSHYVVPNPDAIAGHGKEIIREVYASYIPNSGTATANKLADRIIAQLSEGEITYHFRLDVRDSTLKVGDVFEVYTERLQGADGIPVPTSFIATEKDRLSPTVYQYRAIRTGFALGSKYRKVAPSSLAGLTYDAATDEQRATYMFIANSSGEFSNSDEGHWVY